MKDALLEEIKKNTTPDDWGCSWSDLNQKNVTVSTGLAILLIIFLSGLLFGLLLGLLL